MRATSRREIDVLKGLSDMSWGAARTTTAPPRDCLLRSYSHQTQTFRCTAEQKMLGEVLAKPLVCGRLELGSKGLPFRNGVRI